MTSLPLQQSWLSSSEAFLLSQSTERQTPRPAHATAHGCMQDEQTGESQSPCATRSWALGGWLKKMKGNGVTLALH